MEKIKYNIIKQNKIIKEKKIKSNEITKEL